MKKEKGITLIALVVTIVILLILAGISISMLTGENGVISQARNAKEATEQAKVEELVSVALASVIAKNNGSTVGITPKMIADQINEDERRSDVYAENETTFSTYIIFPKENRKAEVNLNVKKEYADNATYDADVNEDDIAPKDLFDYEIINDGSTADLTLDNLPTKTVRITRIKPEYCNSAGYNPYTNKYDLTDTNYEIIYNGTKISDTLIIPYQVDGKYVPNGIEGEYYKVTEACIYASSGYSQNPPRVKKIIFPNTITKITGSAKYYNDTIEEVVLSKNIKNIDSYAFYACETLKNITIPDGVTSIGACAFSECSSLTSITIGDSVTSIGNDAFYGCSSLTSITIPDSVTSIERSAFEYCSSLTNITIGDGVTSIGNDAFYGCSSLTSITIPDSVTSIERSAFAGCSSLTSITIPDGVTSIGIYAFSSCSSLTSIVVSESNSVYDSRNNCNAIIETSTNELILGCNTTVIPDGVTSIRGRAFSECNSLTSITIPDSVTSIEDDAFRGCSSLTSIVVSEGNNVYDSRNNCNAIIQTSTNELILGCNTTVILDSVAIIGDWAFGYCSSLTSITIPDSVRIIGSYAFYGCSSLTTVNYIGTEELWNTIPISSGNSSLTNATKNYNYTGE